MNNHILIVDDNLNNLRIAVDILINENYRITTARSGVEALEALEKSTMDLILLDINMPRMDGFETIHEIKKNDKWRNIPVLFVTSHREEEFLEKAFNAGCVDFIIKPFRPTEFLARVRTHLSLSIHKSRLQELVDEKTDQLKATIEELQISKKIKDDFIGIMSHELRTPLSGIVGMIELLKIPELKDSYPEFLTDLELSTSKLSRLITDILDFSTIDEPRAQTCTLPTTKANLITQIEQLVSHMRHDNVNFSIAFSDDMPKEIIFDLSSVLKVLDCLLDNAFKFTQEGSVVLSVAFSQTKRDAGEISFIVSDSGPGIDEKYHETIFEKFFQVDSGINRLYEGTGLGLAIARRICDSLGARITLDSSPGNGSSFSFALQVEIHDERTDAEEKKKVSQANILIVEDLPTNQMFLKKILSLKDCNILVAEDHKKAFEILSTEQIDLIFMDYMLPEMDGAEICARIRAMGCSKEELPIIAVTAKADDVSRQTCIDAGMNSHISKPFSATDIFAILAHYFRLE